MSVLQVAAALLAAALAAGAIVARARGRTSNERLLLALAVAAALAVYASGLTSKLPDPKKLIGDVAETLGPWTYALVGLLAFLETGAFVGLVAPGETVVIAGGVIAGQGEIDLIPLIGLVWLCATLGDTTSFFVGRRLGRAFLVRHGPRVKVTEERLHQVEDYFQRHGGKTILIGRFIGLVRALAPFIAGSSGLPYRRFVPYSVVGTGLWATTFCVLGYVFWQSFDKVAHVAGQAVFAFGVVVAVIVGCVAAYRTLRDPEKRSRLEAWLARQEERRYARPLFRVLRPLWSRVLRPAWRFIAPQARFVWGRITPGGLGLELTTTLAIGGVGAYVFVLYTLFVVGDPGPHGIDARALDLSDTLRSGTLVDVAKLVSGLGALPTVAALVALCAIALALRRRPIELVALVVGFALVYVAVNVAKAGVDRPRPPGPLTGSSGSSFPSGHAAYATAWVAAAVVITRRLGVAAALVTVALVVAAAIGLSRVYLRVHFFSDVAAGWALGAAIFGALGVLALVVSYVRDNVARAEPVSEPPPAAARER
ncbi:MAG: VTT domain-containing protein [Nocardioidaceae bacterium]